MEPAARRLVAFLAPPPASRNLAGGEVPKTADIAVAVFAEAPALSADGRSLYYHHLDGNRYVISRISRP
jgi:hypothetical protein